MFASCQEDADAEHDIVPVIPIEQADFIPVEDMDFGAPGDIGGLLGVSGDNSWITGDFDFAGTVLPPADDNDMGFDFGTPLEMGNTFDDDLPLETGMTIETGTGPPADATPVIGITPIDIADIIPIYVPLEADDDALSQYADEELGQAGADLPKTNDLFSVFAVALGVFSALALLKVSLKRNKVGA